MNHSHVIIPVPLNPQFNDLTGERFGTLDVLGYTGKARSNRTSLWLCRCICGEEVVIGGPNLRAGESTRCSKTCRISQEDSFYENIKKIGSCWIWQAATDSSGYGTLKRNYVTYSAHRYSYELHVGPIEDGAMILHRCDTPPCVNPAHLRAGTRQDNADDWVRRGVGPAGSRREPIKITQEIAQKIRLRYLAGGVTHRQLAKEFRINRSTVSWIVRFA
jgi:hypothetical protein